MPTTLTIAELATLDTMEAQAQADQIAFWEVYQWLGDLLQTKGVPLTDANCGDQDGAEAGDRLFGECFAACRI